MLKALPEWEGQPIKGILDGVYQTGNTFIGKEVPVQIDRNNTGQAETCYFNFVCQAMRDGKGKILGILVFAYEVTEQLLARKRVESGEEKLRIALDAGKMGTWHLDLINDTSMRSVYHDYIFGYKTQLEEWGYEQFMAHIHPDDKRIVETQFQIATELGELSLEARIIRADLQQRWIAVKGEVFYENGQATRMAGVVMDVSGRKEAESKLQALSEELVASNEELKAANEEIYSHIGELSITNNQLKLINSDLDNFIYTASHDLKAPISNIEGLMKLLVHNLSPEDLEKEVVQKMIGLIDTSIERFRKTIGELTDIAKLRKEVKENTMISIPDVIQEVQLDLQTLIGESAVKVEVKAADCPQIHFSHKNLKSIIYNLLSNAIKYRSHERSPRVLITCYPESGNIVLMVQDNGLGIKTKDLNKIFSMFTRLHTHVEGSGVGLYLVKRIIDNAGGTLEVESEEGSGSTFKVVFPPVLKPN